MKRIISAAALSVLTAVLVSGCAGAATPAPTPAAATAPTPTKDQQASLLAEFNKVAPVADEIRCVQDARHTCHLILAGSPDTAQISSAKRLLSDAKTPPTGITDASAKQIIDTIKTNGFCKTAS